MKDRFEPFGDNSGSGDEIGIGRLHGRQRYDAGIIAIIESLIDECKRDRDVTEFSCRFMHKTGRTHMLRPAE